MVKNLRNPVNTGQVLLEIDIAVRDLCGIKIRDIKKRHPLKMPFKIMLIIRLLPFDVAHVTRFSKLDVHFESRCKSMRSMNIAR